MFSCFFMLWTLRHRNCFNLTGAFQLGGLTSPRRKPRQPEAGSLLRKLAWVSLTRKSGLFNNFLNTMSWLVQPLAHTFWLRGLSTWGHTKIAKGAFRLNLLPWEVTSTCWADEDSKNSCLAELKSTLSLWSFPQTAEVALSFLVARRGLANTNILDLGFFFPCRPFTALTASVDKLRCGRNLSNFFFRRPRPLTHLSGISAFWAKATLGRHEAYGIDLADSAAGLPEHPTFDAIPLQTLDCRAVAQGGVSRPKVSLAPSRLGLSFRPGRAEGHGLTRLTQLRDFNPRKRQAVFLKKGSLLAKHAKKGKAVFHSPRLFAHFESKGARTSLIPYVKYKPGFLSEWRACRQLFLACMHLPAWRQHRITRFISSLARLTAFSFIRLLWLSLGFVAHHSALAKVFIDGWVSVRAGAWAVNGLFTLNPFYQLYQGDWLCYYKPRHRLGRPLLSKTRQESGVESLYFTNFGAALPYTEIDELTQTVTVIFEPSRCSAGSALGTAFPFSTLRMYNWKYTT